MPVEPQQSFQLSATRDLTQGSIPRQIIKLSLPIMGTSFVQMAYNLTDMLWLGHAGSNYVAAVGAASYFTWFGVSVMLIARIGAEVGISQSLGAGNQQKALRFANNSVSLVLLMAFIFGVITFIFGNQLISLFKIDDAGVHQSAVSYLKIIAVGAFFYYSNPTFTGIFNGTGNPKMPFRINATGLIFNIILDPVFIYGWWFIPRMGSDGAAIATILSQAIVTILFWAITRRGKGPFANFRFSLGFDREITKKIFQLGLPVALHSILFASFGMVLTRIISQWGALPIAIQSVGAQIEALSWMTASGFSTALGVFTGQNFGAGNWDRIFKGYMITLAISSVIGIAVTILFLVFGHDIFSAFIPEKEAIALGAVYLAILAISQLFMCVEITTGGAFNGIGQTFPPSAVGILLTGARIPMALVLSQPQYFGVTGVWWSITISSVLKGIVLLGWYHFKVYRNHPEKVEINFRDQFIRFIPSRVRQEIFDNKLIGNDEK